LALGKDLPGAPGTTQQDYYLLGMEVLEFICASMCQEGGERAGSAV